jgi:hypothetical protein
MVRFSAICNACQILQSSYNNMSRSPDSKKLVIGLPRTLEVWESEAQYRFQDPVYTIRRSPSVVIKDVSWCGNLSFWTSAFSSTCRLQ